MVFMFQSFLELDNIQRGYFLHIRNPHPIVEYLADGALENKFIIENLGTLHLKILKSALKIDNIIKKFKYLAPNVQKYLLI